MKLCPRTWRARGSQERGARGSARRGGGPDLQRGVHDVRRPVQEVRRARVVPLHRAQYLPGAAGSRMCRHYCYDGHHVMVARKWYVGYHHYGHRYISTTPKQNPPLTQKIRLNKATKRNTKLPFLHSDEVLLGLVTGIVPVYYVNW
jgi:hypothetical protein